MFSTCCFCHAPLGANDSIEHFPVGRRLAFDGERGRLWAVCPRCARWNLAPIEERWEAIESCERAYRGATQRVSTDNIALARVKEGTDLVRIGRPLLPEFSLWRYGRMLSDRARRWARLESAELTALLASLAATSGMLLGHRELMWTVGPLMWATGQVGDWTRRQRHRPLEQALRHRPGFADKVSSRLYDLRLRHDETGWTLEESLEAWRLALPRRLQRSPLRLAGAEVMNLMPSLLVVTSASVAPTDDQVQSAVQRVERGESVDELMRRIATSRWLGSAAFEGKLAHAPVDVRLALEMTLQQDDERRALAGELGALYARWEEAERIARIADGELTRLATAD
jgi:hypothetical protein